MEGENKKALKYLTNQPASVHNYSKLIGKSESPRTHSSPTSILRKFPHSLRHDQKHQTKIKRDVSPDVSIVISGMSPLPGGNRGNAGEPGSDDSEDRPSSTEEPRHHGVDAEDDDPRKKRKFSEASSDCSTDSDVWKPRQALVQQPLAGLRPQSQTNRQTVGSVKKLSVINNSREHGNSVHTVWEPRRRTEFPVHKSTPNLLRSESPSHPEECGGDGKRESGRSNGDVPLRSSDSLPQLDQTYRILHSILPKINRIISESDESLSHKKPYVRSESHVENFRNRMNRTDLVYSKMVVDGKSEASQSEEEESEGLSLIDSRKSIVIESSKERKSRWSYKKSVPSLRHLMNRKSRGGDGAGLEEGGGGGGGGVVGGAAAPLMSNQSPRSESCSSLSIPQIRYFDEDEEEFTVKKCETAYALTNLIRAESNLQVEPMKAINRLRVPPNGFYGSTCRMCSRCSSLLSMASSSRYSINTTGSGFVTCSPTSEKCPEPTILCKLCLMEVPLSLSMEIHHCGCVFCKDCMRLYVEFEIQEGAYDISCPDAQCMKQGVVTIAEVETLVLPQMMERYLRFRLNHEVDMDRNRTWCPRAGCETVCNICPREKCAPTSVHCPTCDSDFCSNCKNTWHQGTTCEENSRRLAKEGRSDFMEPGIPFDSDSIKSCPMCNVPIEKDEGCAQMMCKRCKHVFCWYCLASLDDDFLLRHYDKGPCKNKLGHSRASVIWHRTQVIGIFAGLGLLLLVASPLLLLAAPCIVCCKCRVCSGTKLDADDDLPEESGT